MRTVNFSLEKGLEQLHDALFDKLGVTGEDPNNLALARLILADIHSIQRHNGLPVTEVSRLILPSRESLALPEHKNS